MIAIRYVVWYVLCRGRVYVLDLLVALVVFARVQTVYDICMILAVSQFALLLRLKTNPWFVMTRMPTARTTDWDDFPKS